MTFPLISRRRQFISALVALALICAGLIYSQLSPIGEVMPRAKAALQSDDSVHVRRERWIAFEPAQRSGRSGFIFYPGGRVSPEAYGPLTRALAESGYLAVIAPMPLNLAILNPDAATDVIAAYPSVQTWVIGGHSLGGVMAARYAARNLDKLSGLALLAAYPEEQVTLNDSGLAVATIYGDRDGMVSVDEVEGSLDRLPPDVRSIQIEGANHAQFGWYGEQAGDLPAAIMRDEQQKRVVEAVRQILQEAGSRI